MIGPNNKDPRRAVLEHIDRAVQAIQVGQSEGNQRAEMRTRVWLGAIVSTIPLDGLLCLLNGWELELRNTFTCEASPGRIGVLPPTEAEIARIARDMQAARADANGVMQTEPTEDGQPLPGTNRKEPKSERKYRRRCPECDAVVTGPTHKVYCKKRCGQIARRRARKVIRGK